MTSRIIKDTLIAGKIKEEKTENQSRNNKGYVPFWLRVCNWYVTGGLFLYLTQILLGRDALGFLEYSLSLSHKVLSTVYEKL